MECTRNVFWDVGLKKLSKSGSEIIITHKLAFVNKNMHNLENAKGATQNVLRQCLAEEVGFEPTRRVNGLRDFESRLFDHLSTPPNIQLSEF